jgi:hypothetical protein
MRSPRRVLPWIALMTVLAGCRSDAVWSPDGRQIALDVKGYLFTFDVAARRLQRRTPGPLTALNPAWSPDGKQLAYYQAATKGEEIGALDLISLDTLSGAQRVLAPKLSLATPNKDAGENLQVNVGNRLDLAQEVLSAAWSPDGSRVVYTAYAGMEPALWIASSEGSGARLLLPEGKNAFRPAWSPDGTRIAFLGIPEEPERPKPGADMPEAPVEPRDQPASLEVIAPDGSGHRVLWRADRQERIAKFGPDPHWTQDGRSLLAVIDLPSADRNSPPDRCELWTVPVDGAAAERSGGVPGPSMFVGLARGRAAFFYAPEKPDERGPRVGLIEPPYGMPRRITHLQPEMFGQKGDKPAEVDAMPVPALSPDGAWIAVPLVPKAGASTLLLQPAGGGQAQRYTIPVPVPAPARAVPPKKTAPKNPTAKTPPRRR